MRTAIALSALGLAAWTARRAFTGPRQSRAVPGRRKSFDTHALEQGARLMQTLKPIQALSAYLDGFHFFADDMGRQMEAHHFCFQLNEDVHQCVIFDGNERSSRLIGVEYIISERLFRGLPEEEKRLWHSHDYEVTSGQLVAPGIPKTAEHRLMEKLVTTYGKIWHTWDTHSHDLPVGIPALMMGFTADGQINPEMRMARDRRVGESTLERQARRRDIPMPEVDPAANSWQSGRTWQLTLEGKPFPQARRSGASMA